MGNRPYVWDGHEETHEYDDIIGLPHYVSATRAPMSMLERAAQFSPYDALTGYSDGIDETGRLTDAREELPERELDILSEKLSFLAELCEAAARDHHAHDEEYLPLVTVTYFVPDAELHRKSKKAGGAYLTHTGRVRKVDTIERVMIFAKDDKGEVKTVRIDDVSDVTGPAVAGIEQAYD